MRYLMAQKSDEVRKVTVTENGDGSNCWLVLYQSNSRDKLAVV